MEPYKIKSHRKKITSKLNIKLDLTTLGFHIIIPKKKHLKKLEPYKIEYHLQIGTIKNWISQLYSFTKLHHKRMKHLQTHSKKTILTIRTHNFRIP